MKFCRQCQAQFEVTDDDRKFYDQVSPVISGKKYPIPEPTLCPDCRQRRRSVFRNELNLYKRKCDATGEAIISIYRPETKVKVYSPNFWWSDKWDPTEYKQEINFNKPFFEQFQELRAKVPRLSLYGKNNENSDYTNHTENVKNCYLCVDAGSCQDCLYSKWTINCRDLVDCYQLEKAEKCYSSLYSVDAYGSKLIYLADGSLNSDFLYNCKSVKNSLMCWNLRQKEYHIENKAYTKEEYEKALSSYDTGSHEKLETYKKRYKELVRQAIRKPSEIINSEHCTGDYVYNCRNVEDSYGVIDSLDSRYCYDSGYLKDCYDVYESAFDCELQYESYACNRGRSTIGSMVCYDVNEVHYSEMCHNSSYLFGCIGLRYKKYCILNKQYSKEEYEEIVPKLIEHMRSAPSTSSGQACEWGEFFPCEMSYFAYNESAAMEFYPMSKEEVLQKSWGWHEDEREYQKQSYIIPDHIKEVTDAILNEILACLKCQKNYRIIRKELHFYRENNLPIPRTCHHCRYLERLSWRNPYKLWNRPCAKCQKQIQTTYSPDRPEIVYCESCYLESIY